MIFVDKQEILVSVLPAIREARRVGVDTEADSLHRYTEKLCLLQVSTPGEDYVFDPLCGFSLKELANALEQTDLIFHGADYDLRLLKKAFDFHPRQIFDTQIASQILGAKEQSLAALVQKYFGETLLKKNQKADWSRRPLTESMIEYASLDTHFLIPMAGLLEKELAALGRSEWVRESCEELIKSTRAGRERDAEQRWRIKGSGALSDNEQVLLKTIWEWREEIAKTQDRPSFKVLMNDSILDIVKWKSAHPREPLGKMPKLSRQLRHHQAGEIDECLRRVEGIASSQLIVPRLKTGLRRLTNAEKKKVQRLKDARREIANALSCDPSVLAPNSVLEKLVVLKVRDGEALRQSGLLKKWQCEVVSDGLVDALREPEEEADLFEEKDIDIT